jgi:collagenase-like PrtC family protease
VKLLAPVRNLDSAIAQIEAGANELYLGGETDSFDSLTFGGRSRFNIQNEKVCTDYQELCRITEYAHQKGVAVMYTANFPFLADDPDGSSTFKEGFLKYVDDGLKAGVDSIVVSDLGSILLLQQEGIKAHLTLSTFQETLSTKQIQFFTELGIHRIVLSYHLTLQEIVELAQNKVEIEAFGHYGCSFYADCNLKHALGETVEDNIGTPCRNSFKLFKGDQVVIRGPFLNAALACSICSLPTLTKTGVYALKLVGRDLEVNQNIQVTMVYARALQMIQDVGDGGKTSDIIAKIKQEILPEWWVQTLCQRDQCKYLENNVTRSYIGRK